VDRGELELIELGRQALHDVAGEIGRVVERTHRAIELAADDPNHLGITFFEECFPRCRITPVSLLQHSCKVNAHLRTRRHRHGENTSPRTAERDPRPQIAWRSRYLQTAGWVPKAPTL